MSIQDVTPELREAMDLGTDSGALVSEIVPDSPAEKAGIGVGDVIVRIDGARVVDAQDLVESIGDMEPDDRVTLDIMRGTEEIELEAVLSHRQDEGPDTWFAPLERLPRSVRKAPLLDLFGGPRLGVEVHEMDEDFAIYFGTEAGEGVLVLKVTPESPADKAGIRSGDVLLRVNGEMISSEAELRREMMRLDQGEEWTIEGLREERRIEWSGEIDDDHRSKLGRFDLREHDFREKKDEASVWTRRQIRRLEREVDTLNEKLERLERRLERMKDR